MVRSEISDPVLLGKQVYRELRHTCLDRFNGSGDASRQLARRLALLFTDSDSTFKVMGISCPLFDIEHDSIQTGFSKAVSDVNDLSLAENPSYEDKLNRFLDVAQD